MSEDFEKEVNSSDFEEKDNYGVGGFLMEITKIFFLAFVIIVPIRVFLFQPFFVQGASMDTAFRDGQYLIVNELGYKQTRFEFNDFKFVAMNPFKELKRGDVIVFRYPRNPKQFFIKRVIAVPGERIEIRDSKVHIYNKDNPFGFVLDESNYLSLGTITEGNMAKGVKGLASDEYFVMGDNRSHSSDSRAWGPISKSDVIGKVLIRAWPFTEARLYLDHASYEM